MPQTVPLAAKILPEGERLIGLPCNVGSLAQNLCNNTTPALHGVKESCQPVRARSCQSTTHSSCFKGTEHVENCAYDYQSSTARLRSSLRHDSTGLSCLYVLPVPFLFMQDLMTLSICGSAAADNLLDVGHASITLQTCGVLHPNQAQKLPLKPAPISTPCVLPCKEGKSRPKSQLKNSLKLYTSKHRRRQSKFTG